MLKRVKQTFTYRTPERKRLLQMRLDYYALANLMRAFRDARTTYPEEKVHYDEQYQAYMAGARACERILDWDLEGKV